MPTPSLTTPPSPAFLVLTGLLLAASCGADMAPLTQGKPFHHRLALQPDGATPDDDKGQRIKRYSASPTHRNRPWVISDELDVGSFNRVVVSLTTRRRDRLRLIFKNGRDRLLGTPAILLPGSPDPQLAIFDVPSLRRREGPVTHLEVSMESGRKGYLFHNADLLSMPLHKLLPDMEGELVSADEEARRAIGLTSVRPLTATAPLPTETGYCALTMAIMQPQDLRVGGQKPRVTVTATDSGRRQVKDSINLGDRVSGDEIWYPLELDLSGLSGPSVTIGIELTVRGTETGACVVTPPLLSRPGTDARTVLLITSDTHRQDALGVEGSAHEVNTPNLDALAARGVRFTDCYTATNVTSPSHVTLMTGTSPRDTGIISNTGHLAEEALTLAERFRENGFVTFAVASVRHLGPLGTGLGQGFDRIAAPTRTTWDAEVSLDHLEAWLPSARGRPLFVWLHLFDVHAPYTPPGEFDRRYYPKDKDPFDPSLPEPAGIDQRWLGENLKGLRDVDYPVAQYRGEVDYMDKELGRLLKRPRFQDGIVVFTADHGESFGSGGVWFSHTGLYPANLRVPLLLAWPQGPGGATVELPVESIDLGRTLLDLAGLTAEEFPGQSLLTALDGSRPAEPRFSLSANGNSASVTLGDWLLILHLRRHNHHMLTPREEHQVELFNIAGDPRCQEDRVTAEGARAAALRRLVIAWLADTSGTSWARRGSEDAEALAQLAALGYAMDSPSSGGRVWFEGDCECNWCGRFEE